MRNWIYMVSLILFTSCQLTNDNTKNITFSIGKDWPEADPEQLSSWSLDKLEKAHQDWKKLNATALMVVESGKVVVSWGDVKTPIPCHSLRKSFLSALVGIEVNNGTINLDEKLADIPINDEPTSLKLGEQQASIRQIIQSRSGIYLPAAYETQAMKQGRPERGAYKPGEFWYYNNWDFNVAGEIYEIKTGTQIFDAFNQYIALPLGMQDFNQPKHTELAFEKEHSKFPAYTFRLSTRDRARFGQLYLQQGSWQNQTIISKDWIDESTTSYSTTGPGVGFGYMWWVSVNGKHLGSNFYGKPFSARGNHGQYIIVIPEMELVIAHSVDKSIATVSGLEFNKIFKSILASRREN